LACLFPSPPRFRARINQQFFSLFAASLTLSQENTMSKAGALPQDKLISDLKAVVADSEELLRATADQAGEKAAAMRDRIKVRLLSAKDSLMEAEQALIEKTKAAAKATDEYVHENPWKAVGVAAGVGLVLGLLIGRR
jgi:ElaB/YqjD/DUF883 family membrane-anchored ribosome-binding protein